MNIALAKKVLAAILLTQMPFFANAQTLSSITSGERFGKRMADISKVAGFGANELRARKISASAQRSRMLAESPMTLGFLKNMSYLNRRIGEESALASIPLVDPELLDQIKAENMPLAQILFQEYKNSDVPPVDRKDIQEAVGKLHSAYKNLTIPQPEDLNLKLIQKTLLLADPIVDWLLAQEIHSVSPEKLLEFATSKLSGDSISAVAILGELFYQETMAISKSRNKEAVLASKMVPLVNEDTAYQVGHNYHFWRVITASIYRGGTRAGRIYGYFDNNLESYRFANRIGFDAADSFLASFP